MFCNQILTLESIHIGLPRIYETVGKNRENFYEVLSIKVLTSHLAPLVYLKSKIVETSM